MLSIKNIPYYFAAAALFIALKCCFSFAGTDDLAFLLKPTDKLVGFLTGSHSVYQADNGYYYEKLNIVIEKSCSGFNFWLICFIMLTFLSLKYLERPMHKIMTFPVALALAYLLTLFINSSRIFVSVVMQRQANLFLPERPHLILHEAVGVLTNLSFLILVYYLTEKYLINRQNAKPA